MSAACPVLRDWDLHDNLDSDGAILFRRFASLALGAVPVVGTPGLYTTQFDANDGVHTPNGLNIANPAVEQSFADAVQDLTRRRHPARRGARPPGSRRLAVRAARIAEDPDPRRAGRRRRLQRDQRRLDRLGREPGLHERPARLELRDGGELHGRRLPERHPHDPHLLAVHRPGLALVQGPDGDVLEQAVGGRGVLRERDPR